MPKLPTRYLPPVNVRFTPADLERVERAATAAGHTRSGFMRYAALTMAAQVLGAPVSQGTTGCPAHASSAAPS
jgi:uncharacterized protein (DUF1778 family)